MIVFAQFSDTHLDGGRHRGDRLAAVMDYLNGLSVRLDAILVTGDVADHGLAEEYEQARALLASAPGPVLSCPGNHDERAAFRAVLHGPDGEPGAENVGAPVNSVHHTANAVYAMCDSTIPGRDDGLLTDDTISWLDRELSARPDVPAFVCFHHPPALLHSAFLDGIRQFGEDRLAGLMARHRQIAAILCGHAHTPAVTTFAGRPLVVAPGVASTVRLPWERGSTLDAQAPAAIAFHIFDDSGRLTTHYRVVPGCAA